MIPPEEQRHVASGPIPGEPPTGSGLVEVEIATDRAADDVLDRARQVVAAVLDVPRGEWDAGGPAPERFPDWFVAACAPEQTPEELQRWLSWWRDLPPAEKSRAEAEQPWSLDDWVHWMQPDERTWFWWDARVEDERRAVVVVDVPGWPSPLGALEWLLKTAGAVETRVLEPSE